jgi:predicted phosphoribosyltransferase/predicted alpha/beta-hydrolase family hydrolase
MTRPTNRDGNRHTGAVESLSGPPPGAVGDPIRFADRRDAGRRLATLLGGVRDEHPIVIGIARGGVPVGAEVARTLGAALDIIVVRKIGAPQNPEYGIGALAEEGVCVLDEDVVGELGLDQAELEALVARTRGELAERTRRYRAGGHDPLPVRARTVVLVDDGLATGRSAQAAARSLRERGARRVILAVPVAAPSALHAMRDFVDEVVCVEAPSEMWAIGLWYEDFVPTADAEVLSLLGEGGEEPIDESVGGGVPWGPLRAALDMPRSGRARGVIAFAHGSGSSAASPRNRRVAASLNDAGFATLLFDLLSPEEESDRSKVFDVELLAERLLTATQWLRRNRDCARLAVGYFGASTGSAAALIAAARAGSGVRAVVSRGGRPDLAQAHLAGVSAPVLLIVGGADTEVLTLNRLAWEQLRCTSELAIVPGATHLFAEPGAMEEVAQLATDWFSLHLPASVPDGPTGRATVA